MTTRRHLTKCILILLLAVFLLAGCYYARTRDLSNGCNKIYVTTDAAEGQVAITETAEQWFVPGHDYDGVSLLIDHNKIANAGTVTVTIYRGTDDECVLRRTLPVVEISRGGYTYFASGETIEAELGEAFYLVATYSGPAAGIVVARTGVMPEVVAGQCSVGGAVSAETMAFGIVTDYQYDPANTRLMTLAFVMLTAALAALIGGWDHIRRNTGRGKGIFLAAYYGVITGLLLIALTMTAQRTYQSIATGHVNAEEATAADRWSLKDDGSLDAYITVPADDICGIRIPVYLPNYLYTSETLTIELQEPITGRALQTSQYTLAELDEDGLYLALDDRYDAGMRLGLHIMTSGISYKDCPGFYMVGSGDTDNTVYYGGDKQEGYQLLLTQYQTAVTHSYARTVLFYMGSVLIGLILAWLLFHKNVPILAGTASGRATQSTRLVSGSLFTAKSDRPATPGSHPAHSSRRRVIAWYVFTILFGIGVIDYAYAEGIRPTQNCIYPEMVSYSADGIHDWEVLPYADGIYQTFTVTNDSLSGVGLMLAGDEMGGSRDNIVDSEIYLELEDGEGNVLDEVWYRVGDLDALRQLLASDYPTELPEGFYYIPLSQDLHVETGTELTMYISAAVDNQVPIQIAENPFDQVHLIAAYHSYRVLPRIYWPAMGIIFVVVIVLMVLAQRVQFSPMAIGIGLAAVTGVTLSLLIPPFCIPDEMTHIKVIYYLSNQLSGSYDAAGPRMLHVMTGDLDTFHNTVEYITANRYNELLAGLFQRQSDNGLIAATRFNNVIHNASIWTYLPSLIGFQLGRVMSVGCMTRIMLARWCNLLAALLMICYGIRKCPIGRNGLMVILLFPQLLQLIASCSYDAMIIAFSFLFVGNVLHLVYERNRSVSDYAITLIAGMFLGVNKYGVYAPILCLVLIPVVQRMMRINKRALMIGAAICVTIAVIAAVQYASAITSYTGSQIYSVVDIIHNPMDFIHLLEHTLVTQGDTLFVNMIASGLGARQVIIPTYVIVAVCVLLYCAWCAELGERRRIGRNVTRYMIAIAVLGVIMLCIAMTVGMTPITGTAIKGLQGRYFLPYFLLADIVGADMMPHRRGISQYRIIYWMGIIHLVTIGMIFTSIFAINNVSMI